jgi:hypothetical protein
VTVKTLEGPVMRPETVRLCCNECGATISGSTDSLIDDGWHWSVFPTDTEYGTVGYAVCPDCGGAEEISKLTQELHINDEDRQLDIIERLVDNSCLEDAIYDPQQTLEEADTQ